MNVDNCIDLFIEGRVAKRKCGNVSFNGKTFYNYRAAIGRRLCDTLFLVKRARHSHTTKRHVNKLINAIPGDMLIVWDAWDGRPVSYHTLFNALITSEEAQKFTIEHALKIGEVREAKYELELAQKGLEALEFHKREILRHEPI